MPKRKRLYIPSFDAELWWDDVLQCWFDAQGNRYKDDNGNVTLIATTSARAARERGDKGPRYSHERWYALIEQSLAEIKKLGELKGGEYAGDVDRLANFRRNGERLDLQMETVWAVYAGKHWDALSQFIVDLRNGKDRERLEPIAGRVDDLLVYLLLFKAMLDERGLLPKA